jgi:hypothetical protein
LFYFDKRSSLLGERGILKKLSFSTLRSSLQTKLHHSSHSALPGIVKNDHRPMINAINVFTAVIYAAVAKD